MNRLRSAAARVAREQEQRARILDATLSISSVAGYSGMSISAILALAAVQRRTFNMMFRGKEDAFLAAYGSVVHELAVEIAAADDPNADPSARVSAGLSTAITFLLADPVRAEIAALEVHAAGPNAVALLRDAVERLVDRTAALLTEAGVDGVLPARLQAELAVGAVHDVLRTAIFRGELDVLVGRVPELTRTAFPTLAADRPPAVGAAVR